MCGNPLQTSRSIEVPRVFQNPKPNPNSSYLEPSRREKVHFFISRQSFHSMSRSVKKILIEERHTHIVEHCRRHSVS
jgi:hypothetical protein